MIGAMPPLASESGRMALRLCALLADPLPLLSQSARDRMVPGAIAPMLDQPALRRSLSASLRGKPECAVLSRIADRLVAGDLPDAARRDFDIALLPLARLDGLLARLAAVIHARRFRAAVLKSDRAALQALFGPELSRLATEEGLSLLAPLGELDDGAPFPPAAAPGLAADHPAHLRALAVLCARLAQGSAEAAALLWWRITGRDAPDWPTLTARQDACLATLLARGGAA